MDSKSLSEIYFACVADMLISRAYEGQVGQSLIFMVAFVPSSFGISYENELQVPFCGMPQGPKPFRPFSGMEFRTGL